MLKTMSASLNFNDSSSEEDINDNAVYPQGFD